MVKLGLVLCSFLDEHPEVISREALTLLDARSKRGQDRPRAELLRELHDTAERLKIPNEVRGTVGVLVEFLKELRTRIGYALYIREQAISERDVVFLDDRFPVTVTKIQRDFHIQWRHPDGKKGHGAPTNVRKIY